MDPTPAMDEEFSVEIYPNLKKAVGKKRVKKKRKRKERIKVNK
jgi:hypothetical protein